MPEVALIPLTEDERQTFLHEEVTDYADQQVRDAGWPPAEALHRARAEITPVFDRELVEAMASDAQLWSAKSTDGQSVGWLWIKPIDGTGDQASSWSRSPSPHAAAAVDTAARC